MYKNELELLNKYLRQARTYLEFGTGASTLHIARENPHLERMVSVDMNRRWINRVRKHAWLRNGSAPKKVKLLHVHIGPIGGFSFPYHNMSRCRRRRHFHAVLDATTRFQHGWDVVLVDSRFRTACALKSLLATNAEDIPRSVVAVHDYTIRTWHYGEIERFADLEEVVGTLAVFRKKRDVDPVLLLRAVEKFEYEPM
eukprot:Skav209446  [mRNA]  locus=scaffold2199:118089:118775:- [translate_table: standard]